MSNKYYWHSRISERKFRHLVRCFAEDKTAVETAIETNLDRKSVNNIFLKIRRRILEEALKNKNRLSLNATKIKNPFYFAQSEADCKKYSTKYKLRVLVMLFGNGLVSADIIYAESDDTFKELRNLTNFKDKGIYNFEFFEIISNPLRVKHYDTQIRRQEYVKNYSGNIFLYFFQRIKKFRGTSWEKFILHLRETEWRFNKIMSNKKSSKTLTEPEFYDFVLKDMYYELLEILRKKPL